MCKHCGTPEGLDGYMDRMMEECVGPKDSQMKFTALTTASDSDRTIVIAQEIDVATLSEDGVTTVTRKNVIVIPAAKLEGFAQFIMEQVALRRILDKIEGDDDDEYEGESI